MKLNKLELRIIKENFLLNSTSKAYQEFKHDIFNFHFYESLAKYENSKKRKIDLKNFLWYNRTPLLNAINYAIQDKNSIQLDDALKRLKFHNPKTIYNCLIYGYMLDEKDYQNHFNGEYYEKFILTHDEYLRLIKLISKTIANDKYSSLFDLIQVNYDF